MTEWLVPLTDTTLDEHEIEAATRVLRSGWVTMGAEVRAFEEEFAAAVGARYAVALANGTAALHLAYEAAGLREGDEFCLPALTFVATMNAGLYLRARPVLIDCASEDDLTLSADDLARKITPRTRLIVTMPYGGFPPDMEPISALARERGIPVVEDACHAPLAEVGGRKIGTFGAAAAWSFFGNKNITTAEGGMVTTDDAALAERVRLMRSHGMATLTWDRHRGHASAYDVAAPGYNYRMDEIRAAIGREQLRKLPEANERRRAAARALRAALEKEISTAEAQRNAEKERGREGEGREELSSSAPLRLCGESSSPSSPRSPRLCGESLLIPFSNPRGAPVHHLFVILLPRGADRDAFRESLRADGVQTSVHYPPLHQFSHTRALFADETAPPLRLPVLEAIAPRLVTLPLGPTLTEAQIAIVAQAVAKALK